MDIFDKLISLENVALALGFFDGVHLGHKAVIKSATDFANKNNIKSAVITFKKHPLEIFTNKSIKYINTNYQRKKLIENLGVDYLFELDFTPEMSNISADDYLKNIIIKYFKPLYISTGFNHSFGHNKNGNSAFLREKSKRYGYKYYEVQPQKIGDYVISSTKIKELLQSGNLKLANQMLGYDFFIEGTVVHGNHIGRTIGFPTANIDYPNNIIELPYGAYCSKVDDNYKAVTNYGIKPTICKQCDKVVESYILNFSKDIYNTDIKVCFIDKIRDEQKFSSLEALVQQIKKDISRC